MRFAALIIGILGAIAGLVGAIFIMPGAGVAVALADKGSRVLLDFGAFLVSMVGLVGAALAIAKPRLSAGLMALSGIVGMILVTVGYVFAAVLLLVASIFAVLGRRSEIGGPSDP